ncbi:MAG: NAD-dependent epimerase/dehydratase family protein [Elusimicrobia bacterium]|nr:NAD-dependent epimerase/dehydratase family protein [Elusimicrobiota bacterium]MBD3412464.1 NAD-dependent epimerase/dehydratase family protein [Elusimicrobiota bacterium]
MDKYLVTGGAGFIGSNIVESLVARGDQVTVLDNLSTGSMDNLKTVTDKIQFIKGDLRSMDDVKKATRGITYVLHQAALRSVERSVEDPSATNDSNITGTLNLLIASRENKVRRLVYASSSSVYGDSARIPQNEEQLPQPVSPYAVSKLAGEHYCSVYAKTFGLETVVLRYFNVFGPRQNPRSRYAAVIPIFMQCIVTGKPLPMHGDGKQSRDFTYIDNVVEANILAAHAPGVSGTTYNAALGDNRSVCDIADMLEKITNKKIKRKHTEPRVGDVRITKADNSRIKKDMDFKGSIGFEDGLKKTWEYFTSQ